MMEDGVDRRDLPLGHDEVCLADLQAVVQGRLLDRGDRSWLARAVAGAVRPSRDRPVWDLAHTIAALGLDGLGLIDLALDPRLASGADFQERFHDRPGTDERGLLLSEPRAWRCSWKGLARVMALAEFLLTADEMEGFAEISNAVGQGLAPKEAPAFARWLAARLAAYRNAHMPAAPVEQRFRAIRSYLRGLGRSSGFDDDDILVFWQTRRSDDTLYATVVEHFITYDRVRAELDTLSQLTDAERLETLETWDARLEAAAQPHTDTPVLAGALALLQGTLDQPKLLTGTEFKALEETLRLDPFHKTRPLTALRVRVFGRIQSGIANRLRRGSGGPDIAERARCSDADYGSAAETARKLSDHLRNCLTIALALRSGDDADPLVEAGKRALRTTRRAGFDLPRERLAAAIAEVDDALATTAMALEEHRAGLDHLNRAEPLSGRLEQDRAAFSNTFATIYSQHIQQEAVQ